MVPKTLILLLLVPTAAADLDGAVAWLQEGELDRLRLTALHAAGVDTYGSGAYAVPQNDATGSASVRALHAAASSGYDPRSYMDPVRGTIDLQAQMLANHAGIMTNGRAADLAWHLLGLHAAGWQGNEIQAAGERLAQMQQGGFPCNQDDLSADCTGFAVAALSTTNVSYDRVGVLDFLKIDEGAYTADDAYGDGANTDTQAWSIIAVQHAGGTVPEAAWAWLLERQLPQGAFQARPGDPGPEATWLFPTSDAVLALAGFPGPAWQDPGLAAQGDGWCIHDMEATWIWPEGSLAAPCVDRHHSGLRLHAVGSGVHARIAFDPPGIEAPAPWPLLSLLAALAWRVGSAGLRTQTESRS